MKVMQRVFYDQDGDLESLRNVKVGVIGYGIQGRAQSLNLRDSGIDVLVGNRSDSYSETAASDGFQVHSIPEVASAADVLLLLIPDQAHGDIYRSHIEPNLRNGGGLVVAHGYSLHYKEIEPRSDIDVMLLAPRMPGRPIRDYFLRGSGVPAFVDVYQDASGEAWKVVLALAKAMGFTRPGALHVEVKHETELDLFVEQFLVPTIIKAIQVSFDELVEAGYPPLPALMELYASGELGEVLLLASKAGIFQGFQKNASPTCQFGIASSYPKALVSDPGSLIQEVIRRLQDGEFTRALQREGDAGYPITQDLWTRMNSSLLSKTQEELGNLIRYPETKGV